MGGNLMKGRLWAAGLVAALVTLTACGSNSGGSGKTTPSSSSQVKLVNTGIGTVLATSAGRTIYWFARDTPTTSNCTGACATFWPPVKGPVTAASGTVLPGTLGTIKRSDGTTQATYDGHPLYTYSGDSVADPTSGNDLSAAGGLWFAMTPSGAKPGSKGAAASPSAAPPTVTPSPSPSSSSSRIGGY
jgi:predicted lipoprotein with Yx(FWY)xxD motif